MQLLQFYPIIKTHQDSGNIISRQVKRNLRHFFSPTLIQCCILLELMPISYFSIHAVSPHIFFNAKRSIFLTTNERGKSFKLRTNLVSDRKSDCDCEEVKLF